MTVFCAMMSLWWCAAVAILLGSAGLALLQPRLAAGRARNRETPPVSVLVPLRDAEEIGNAASRSVVAQAYPEVEILFSVRGGARFQSASLVQYRLVETTARPGSNPKIANLIEPVEQASHDFLLIKDVGTVLAPDALAAMMRSFTAGIGLVCAVPIARAPASFIATVEASLINTYGGRMLMAVSALGGGAGIGAAMLLKRGDLQAAGGLQAIATAIADDHALAKALSRRGLRTVFMAQTVDQPLGVRRLPQVWRRHLRWAICRRLEEPAAFVVEPLAGLVAACLAGGLAANGLGVQAVVIVPATLLLWPLVETVLAALKGWPLRWSMPLAILLRELAMPALWLHALLLREIAWGDTRIAVRGRGA